METFLVLIAGMVIGVIVGFLFSGLLSSANFADMCRECLEYRNLENKNEQKTKEETDKN